MKVYTLRSEQCGLYLFQQTPETLELTPPLLNLDLPANNSMQYVAFTVLVTQSSVRLSVFV